MMDEKGFREILTDLLGHRKINRYLLSVQEGEMAVEIAFDTSDQKIQSVQAPVSPDAAEWSLKEGDEVLGPEEIVKVSSGQWQAGQRLRFEARIEAILKDQAIIEFIDPDRPGTMGNPPRKMRVPLSSLQLKGVMHESADIN